MQPNSLEADALRRAKVILFDEIFSIRKDALHAMAMFTNEICLGCPNTIPYLDGRVHLFADKFCVLSGDRMHILPIVPYDDEFAQYEESVLSTGWFQI